ncbi:MAG TPA: hypothetical protein GXX40_09740 [Firmicutes bacterium]|nr:hypothetical protein [Bacillota bacterium]
MGDIGCLSAIHGCTCMEAGIWQAHGPEIARRTVAVIGDSIFFIPA